MLDDWEAQASLGRMPVEELVMVQCAGSRDRVVCRTARASAA